MGPPDSPKQRVPVCRWVLAVAAGLPVEPASPPPSNQATNPTEWATSDFGSTGVGPMDALSAPAPTWTPS